MYENRVELDITISYSILAPQLYEVFMIESKELPGEQLIGLINLLHNTLQTDGDLCYKVDYWRDINAVYKGGTCLVWYGGLKVTHWDFPELIRIHPCLGRRINNDIIYPIHLFEHTMVGEDSFGPFCDYGHKVVWAGISEKEYRQIKTEMESIGEKQKQAIEYIITGLSLRNAQMKR